MDAEDFGLVPSTYISAEGTQPERSRLDPKIDANVRVEHATGTASTPTVPSSVVVPLDTRHSIIQSNPSPSEFDNDFDEASIKSPKMQSPVKTISSETSNAIEYYPVTVRLCSIGGFIFV